jgi:hypothetical protein
MKGRSSILGKHRKGDVWIDNKGKLCVKTASGTKSYYRWLVECYIGYHLPKNLTIHHIDGNRENNSLSNLMIVSDKLHSILHQFGFAETDVFVSNLFLYKKDKINTEEINRSI